MDLANVLLLQGEMQERMRYLKEGNLFAYDVQADRDMHERDEFIDRVSPGLDIWGLLLSVILVHIHRDQSRQRDLFPPFLQLTRLQVTQ